jgi:hypothetical protein
MEATHVRTRLRVFRDREFALSEIEEILMFAPPEYTVNVTVTENDGVTEFTVIETWRPSPADISRFLSLCNRGGN